MWGLMSHLTLISLLHLTSKMYYFQCTAKSLQDMKSTKNSKCTKYNKSIKSKYGLEGGAAWVEVLFIVQHLCKYTHCIVLS